MKQKVFSIYDSKTEVFDFPIYGKTTNEIIRELSRVVNTENDRNKFYLYPQDFTLFELGTFDDSDGKFDSLSTPHSLLLLHDLKVESSPVVSEPRTLSDAEGRN